MKTNNPVYVALVIISFAIFFGVTIYKGLRDMFITLNKPAIVVQESPSVEDLPYAPTLYDYPQSLSAPAKHPVTANILSLAREYMGLGMSQRSVATMLNVSQSQLSKKLAK